MLYSTLILPYYYYCNIIWACNYPSTLHKLSVLQKRAMRIISSAGYRDHAAVLFNRHRQLTLTDINRLQIAVFVFKSLNHFLPSLFNNYFMCNSSIHSHFTRSANNLHPIKHRSKTRYFSIKVQGPIVWNALTSDVCVTLLVCIDLNVW